VKNDSISVIDYAIYMDIIYHGTDDEKNEVSFMMLDVRGEGMIILDSFERFWL
jgi:hypothetical protein